MGEGLRKERQGKEWKGSQQPANQPARILGYKQPQMLNFRHNQCRVVERGGEAVRSWGSRTRNRSKTDSRRQPQANCWQGRSEGSCRGWKEVVCGSHSRLSENEDENEMETQNEARRGESRRDSTLWLSCCSSVAPPTGRPPSGIVWVSHKMKATCHSGPVERLPFSLAPPHWQKKWFLK